MITDGPTPEEIEAFVAGELADEDAERVREAIVRDPRVAAEVEDILQLRAAVADAAPAAKRDAPVIPIAARRERRRSWMIAGGVAVVAAAAGLIFWIATRPPRARVPAGTAVAAEVRGALAAHRGLEPRLAWSALDGHRPYDVARAAGSTTAEALPLALLARIEALKDPRALSAAQLAAGRVDDAARALEAAPITADVASDRAAVALVRRDPELALVHAAAALALAPEHAQARWNRALALAQLGLDRSAAAAFAEIAARGEAGWSGEAEARAAALRAQRKRADDASTAADTAGVAFVAGGAPPVDLVATFPDRMRLYFYDAVRTAATAERLAALRPIAKALDLHFGETTLVALLDRVAASDLARRAPLAARYMAVRGDPAAATALVTAATKAKADDLAIGALLFTGSPPGVVAPAQLDRYRALAERGGDPWFALAAVEQQANLLFADDDVSGAEAVLAGGLDRCKTSRLVLRCQRIQRLLVHAYKLLHRVGAARRMLDDVLRSARETGTVRLENDLLQYAGALALWRDDVRVGWEPVAGAYLAEWALGLGTCVADRLVRETRATALINRHRNDEARAVFAGEPACPEAPPSRERLFALAHLTGADAQRVAALRADIAATRAAFAADDPEQAFLDHVEGRALLGSDPAAARVLLRKAASSTATGPTAEQARAYSYAALIDDAAARGAWAEAADLFAQELGRDRAAPCTLGASVDREETYVATDAKGGAVGARAAAPLDGGQSPVPAPVVAALAGCERVTVIGRGAYHGRPGLLPAGRPWSYRSRRARAAAGKDAPIDRAGPTLIVAGALPPPRMLLPALAPLGPQVGDAQVIEGAAATPDRVLAAMQDASYVELHAHGVLDAEGSAASFIALSPDAAGRFTLTAEAVAASSLRRRPVVVLAACHSGVSGTTHDTTGGLADAFVAAGARAVIASPDPIADADAERFFAGLRARIAAGTLPAQALRDERAAWTEPGARAWIDALVVIE